MTRVRGLGLGKTLELTWPNENNIGRCRFSKKKKTITYFSVFRPIVHKTWPIVPHRSGSFGFKITKLNAKRFFLLFHVQQKEKSSLDHTSCITLETAPISTFSPTRIYRSLSYVLHDRYDIIFSVLWNGPFPCASCPCCPQPIFLGLSRILTRELNSNILHSSPLIIRPK